MKLALIIVCWIPVLAIAQSLKVKGEVKEAGETLPLAHIVVLPDSLTEVSDVKGRFSFSLSPGNKEFIVSYTGYKTLHYGLALHGDTTLNFSLQPNIGQLDEVVVTSQRDLQDQLFQSTRMSTNVLMPEDVTAIPVLGGEADLIKVLQLMPGTVRGVEGSSDLFIRGGAADQNLVLLDDATIYNTSHLLGFVSVFNPDVLETVESINGGFPAEFGGRLSSILNVKSKSSIADETHVSGDIGLIASRLFIEQPIIKDKASVWVAGRRTYVDQVIKLINEELPYFFYDINARLLLKPSTRDDISISYYKGDDDLDIFRDRNKDGVGFLTSFQAGNSNLSMQWKHQMAGRWNSSLTVLSSSFDYDILNAFRDSRLQASSNIDDFGTKVEFSYVGENQNHLKLGGDWTRHVVSPSVVNSSGTFAEFLGNSSSQGRLADEVSLYGQYEWSPHSRWLVNAGLRTSMAVVRDTYYWMPEPRLSIRYSINDKEALKLSYSRMAQYLHRIANSAVTSPTDIWYPVTDSIRPQTSHQVTVGWQKTFPKKSVMVSAEVYYKPMQDMIGLEEGTNLFFNSNFQSSLIQGKGRAYGLELMIRKNAGRFTGWISYTLSKSERQFNQLNNNLWFPSRYDRRHNGAIVAQYAISPRWSVSAVWEYISGARFTPIIGQYQVLAPSSTGVDLIPAFAPINSVKLSDAHRLDLGIKFKSRQDRKFRYEWFAGVYNAYNRTNPVAISIAEDEFNGDLKYEQPGLIGLLPFLSYGFKF